MSLYRSVQQDGLASNNAGLIYSDKMDNLTISKDILFDNNIDDQ